jgi:hypothetical protein
MESKRGERRKPRHKKIQATDGAGDSLESLALSFLQVIFMAKAMPIGARGAAEETVEFKHTLTSRHPQLPPVYSGKPVILSEAKNPCNVLRRRP